MFRSINEKVNKKVASQQKKLKSLGFQPKRNIFRLEKANIVENLSSQTFNTEELNLLDKGLKFALPTSNTMIEEVIAGIESSIQRLNEPTKIFVREACRKTITENLKKDVNSLQFNKNENIIKGLRGKDCFYLKADKGNKIVIIDKKDYYERVDNLISNGPYKLIKKNPLPRMITEVNNVFKKCDNIITLAQKRRLHVSNASVPKLYCLPKIHKPGKLMRPIVSAVNAPTSQISKWLTNEFNNLPVKQPSFSVNNSLDFINKIKTIQLQSSEILVSFDVSSLFPSVPIPQTLVYLEELLVQNNLDQQSIKEYIQLTDLCMKQNIFQYNGSFYCQNEGTAMGNSLSPFLADLFMSRFEKDLEQKVEYFPRVWLRYVDDIFAIFDRDSCDIADFIISLNSQFNTIKFTYEVEQSGQLPFLDVMVIRNNNRINFDIYRKESNTLRYITSDSNHCYQHKISSLSFLTNRLCTYPLNKKRYGKELRHIQDVARLNGFNPDLINKLVRKIRFKQSISKSSTFQRESKLKNNFVSIPYNPRITRGLKSIFNELDLQVIFTSRSSLKSLLGNPKDKVGSNEKSGIYEINCSDCDKKYIGQTKRPILTRFKEHMAHLRYGRLEKSSVAQHAFDSDHRISVNNLKLVRQVNNCRLLNSLESLEIYKNRGRLLNADNGPLYSTLFKLLEVGEVNVGISGGGCS